MDNEKLMINGKKESEKYSEGLSRAIKSIVVEIYSTLVRLHVLEKIIYGCLEMPVSKKRKKKNKRNEFEQVKHLIRGARQKYTAIVVAAAGMNAQGRGKLYSWLKSFPSFTGKPFVSKEVFSEPDLMFSSPALKLNDLTAQLAWSLQKISTSTKVIEDHITLKEKFEQFVVSGELMDAKELLDLYLEKCGVSCWYIENYLNTIYQLEGLDRLKDETKRLASSKVRSLINPIVIYISERIEDEVTAGGYYSKLSHVIGSANLDTKNTAYLHFRLNRLFNSTDEDIISILSVENTSSVVDVFETLVSLMVRIKHDREDVSRKICADLVGEGFGYDPRVNKIASSYGYVDDLSPDVLPSVYSCFLQFLETGKVCEDLPFLKEREPSTVSGVYTLLRAVHCYDQGNEDNAFLYRLGGNIINSVNDISLFADATDSIMKLKLNYYSHCWQYVFEQIWERLFDNDELKTVYDVDDFSQFSIVSSEASEVINRKELCREFYFNEYFSAKKMLDNDQYAEAAEAFGLVSSKVSHLAQIDAQKQCVHSALKGGDTRFAIQQFVNSYTEDNSRAFTLPLRVILSDEDWDELEGYSNMPELAILLDLHWRYVADSKFSTFRRFAVEEYLYSQNVERPSELEIVDSTHNKKAIIHFLRDVCVSSVLDSMPVFEHSREILEERRAICAILVNEDPANKELYNNEIRSITTELVAKRAQQIIDKSRIFVDEEGLYRWADKNLKEEFNRYKAFVKETGDDTYPERFKETLLNILKNNTKFDSTSEFWNIPDDFGDDILTRLILRLRDEFLSHHEYGLNSYLSMRVRHGTFAGKIRSSLEGNNIVCQKLDEMYQANNYWVHRFENDAGTVNDLLKSFSKRHDDLINKVRDSYLQVLSDEKPEGKFNIEINAVYLHDAKANVFSGASFRSVMKTCTGYFWTEIDKCLEYIRSFVVPYLRVQCVQNLRELESDIRELEVSSNVKKHLMDKCGAARTGLLQSIDEIENWFRLPESAEKITVSGEELLEIGLESFKQVYPTFDPIVETDTSINIGFEIENVNIFYDIFHVAFENVHKRSGYRSSPPMSVGILHPEEGQIVIAIKNKVHNSLEAADIEKQINEIKECIDSGAYLEKISTEDGSGLMKLKNIVDRHGGECGDLQFGLSDYEFSLKVTTSITEVEQ